MINVKVNYYIQIKPVLMLNTMKTERGWSTGGGKAKKKGRSENGILETPTQNTCN